MKYLKENLVENLHDLACGDSFQKENQNYDL